MSYKIIKISNQNEIAGFNEGYELLISSNNWFPISDEIFEFIMKNNGSCFLKSSDDLLNRINEFNKKRQEIDISKLSSPIPSLLSKDDLTLERPVDMDYVRSHQQDKNRGWMEEYIMSGIMYRINGKRINFTFYPPDQLNYMETMLMISNGIYTDKVGIFYHDVMKNDQTFVSVEKDEFIKIYKKLLFNKYYNIFYCEELNKYVMTLNSKAEIDKLSYLTLLPQEYYDRISKRMNDMFGSYFDGMEVN